jgi:hypothetical protein
MNQAKKLVFYIVLNIIVSAVTILGVLYIWEKTQLKNVLLDSGGPVAEVSPDPGGETSEGGETGLLIDIAEVGGVGNLATEYVRLSRPDSDPGDTVSLQGWRLTDGKDNDFVILEQSGLPSLELHGQGAVNIYTKEGASNPIELYLGLSDSIWGPGESVQLIDPDGVVHDTYVIP